MNYLFNLAEYSLDHNYWLPQFSDEKMDRFLSTKNEDPELSRAGGGGGSRGGGPGSGTGATSGTQSSHAADRNSGVPSGAGSRAPSDKLSLEAITATLNTHFSHLKPIVFAPAWQPPLDWTPTQAPLIYCGMLKRQPVIIKVFPSEVRYLREIACLRCLTKGSSVLLHLSLFSLTAHISNSFIWFVRRPVPFDH